MTQKDPLRSDTGGGLRGLRLPAVRTAVPSSSPSIVLREHRERRRAPLVRRDEGSVALPAQAATQSEATGAEIVDHGLHNVICTLQCEEATETVRRECRSTPPVVDGQIHGGITQGLGPPLYEEVPYDWDGYNLAGLFMDCLVPTAVDTPAWETWHTVTPSQHPPLGAKGVGESATVGLRDAITNAVVDALAHLGVTHMDVPVTPDRVWGVLRERGVAG